MVAEFVATFGLLITILALARLRIEALPFGVGLYIRRPIGSRPRPRSPTGRYIARCLTATFAGIAPSNAPLFVMAEFAGALAGVLLMGWLLRRGELTLKRTDRFHELSTRPPYAGSVVILRDNLQIVAP